MMPIKFDKKYLRENIVKPRLVKVVNTLQDYTSVSTIAGVCYFNRNSTAVERIFWSICLILLLSFAGYNSWQAFDEWQNTPWITTMTSAAVPIKELPFPSVTFCSIGTPAKMASAIESRMASNINVSETEMTDIVDYYGLSSNFKVNGTWAFSLLYPHFNNLNYISNYFYMLYIYFLKIKNIEVYLIKDYYSANLGFYFEKNNHIDLQEIEDGKYPLEIDANEANYSDIFPEIIQHLWYSSTPCFDISDLTAEEDNESSFLRNCQWKGVTINCAAIFSTVPTDVGLCCGFNIMAAEEMFTTSKFTEMITFMQNYDKSLAFFSTDLPDWYLSNREPMSKVGKNMGLQVTLDAHSDVFDFASVETDFTSFELLISKSKDFPLTSEKSLPVSMGHHTLIALSGYILKADPSLHNVDANSKECLFPNEYGLKLFKSYYQSNCYFECTLKYVQTKMLFQTNSSRICTPWYFPFIDEDDYICNSRKTKVLFVNMKSFIPEAQCGYCKPDCETYHYLKKVSKEPLRKCDDYNANISPYCKFRKSGKIPVMWWQQFNHQLLSLNYTEQDMFRFKEGITSNIRANNFSKSLNTIYIFFDKSREYYDAYTQDISVVNIFFDTTTCWKFTTSASSNWTIYISTLGGIFGLFVAASFATLVELTWLIIQILSSLK